MNGDNETINEQIEVLCHFGYDSRSKHTLMQSRSLKVIKFKWQEKIYNVDKTQLVQKAYKGKELVYLVSVSGSFGSCQLRYYSEQYKWILNNAWWE